MKITLKRLSLAIAGAGLLTIYGCGGGGSSDATVAATTSTTVTPSLGKFSPGTVVKLSKPDGTELTTGKIGDNGAVTLSYLASYTGPVVVTVVGAAGVTYFDEGTGADAPFGAGSTLQAVLPAPQTQVGVTALTNAAVANLVATGGIANATALTVNDANAKVAAVFGLTDILVAPNPVSATTGNTLNLALPADKYALVLAAFAKSAPTGSSAAALATNLATDLKDGKLDNQNSGEPILEYTLTPTMLASAYQTVASTLATTESQTLAANTPLVVTPDATNVVAVTNQSDVTLAKAMFAELRTTLNSFSNGNKTGFLDTQTTAMNADLNANVAPEMGKVAGRISALSSSMTAYEDAKAITNTNAMGFVTGFAPNTTTPALTRSSGSLGAVWNGTGSYEYCWTDATTPSAITKVSCTHAGSDSADLVNNRIKTVVFALTGTGTNAYSYTATRYNKARTSASGQPLVFAPGTLVSQDALGNPMPVGSGTVSKTVAVDGTTLTALAINGTMPPSASTPANTIATGADTLAISAVRTALTGNNFHYALSGSVSTSKLTDLHVEDPTKVVSLSLDSGTYFDLDQTDATNEKLLSAKIIGTAQTLASKFTGTLEMGAGALDKDNLNYSPTSVTFTGSISDTSAGGTGQFLSGKLEGAVTNYSQFQRNLPETSSNFMTGTVTFTGTLQAPSRPLLKLILAGTKTGFTTGTMTLNYSYGTNISITGSGVVDSANSASNTMTLSNQNGIQFVVTPDAGIRVTKAGKNLATILNGSVNYADGVSESLM